MAGGLGTALGILSGYLGGWVDQVIMRLTDAWLALPALVFAIFLATVRRPQHVEHRHHPGAGLLDPLCAGHPRRGAELARARVRQAGRDRRRLAALRVILRHILPNVLNTTMVLASLTIGVVIIAEASLSFLGVGVPPPEPAWGLMLSEARSTLMAGKWWLTVFPGVCILLVVLATQLLGDWLRIRLDPQLRNL